jgi:hypothetical protein
VKRTFPDGRSMGNYNVLTIIHAQIFLFADYPCMTSDESEKLIFFLCLLGNPKGKQNSQTVYVNSKYKLCIYYV